MAIKIIKLGKKPDTVKRFTCEHCGCVFEADRHDYEETFDGRDGCYYYEVDYPNCGCTVYGSCDE